jgi:hypothetical protein
MGLLAGIKVAALSLVARLFFVYLIALTTPERCWTMHQLAFRSLSRYLRSHVGHQAGRLLYRFRFTGRKLHKRGHTMKGAATFVIDPGIIESF